MRALMLFLSCLTLATACSGGGSGTEPTPQPQLPTISIADSSVLEGDAGVSILEFSVTLSTTSASNVSVSYATGDFSAEAGSDYTATSGTLTITSGNISATIFVDVIGDTTSEPTRLSR